MNKISIITINRNNDIGLEKTIISVISQTYKNYEFIVIDGNSEDNSFDVIQKYNHNLTYWISEPDSGIYNAMNKGIRQSSGDYCYFLNSGDYLVCNDTLKNIFENKTYDAPFINGNQINIIEGGHHIAKALNRTLTLYDLYWGTIKHQATFIKKDLFIKYGLYDENLKIISDWKFFLETIGLNNEQPDFINEDIVFFPWEGISTNPKWMETHNKERKLVIDSLFPKSIQIDYEHLRDLNNYNYIVKLMKTKSIFSKLVKGLVKVFK